MSFTTNPATQLRGTATLPGDIHCSHLVACLAASAEGTSSLAHFAVTPGTLDTLECLGQLGAPVDILGDTVTIEGVGADGFAQPEGTLDCGAGVATLALLMALLAGRPGTWELTTQASINHQLLNWMMHPLRLMGATITADASRIRIVGADLQGTLYPLPAPSELLKTMVLLAGVSAGGQTAVIEPAPISNRIDAVFEQFGIPALRAGASVGVAQHPGAPAIAMEVQGDLYTAAALATAASLRPDWDITLRHWPLNTLNGLLDLLGSMGAGVTESVHPNALQVTGGVLMPIQLAAATVLQCNDFLPYLMIAATQAAGVSSFELPPTARHWLAPRVEALVISLQSAGAEITTTDNGWKINGPTLLRGGNVEYAGGDVAAAMALATLGPIAQETITVEQPSGATDEVGGLIKVLNLLRA